MGRPKKKLEIKAEVNPIQELPEDFMNKPEIEEKVIVDKPCVEEVVEKVIITETPPTKFNEEVNTSKEKEARWIAEHNFVFKDGSCSYTCSYCGYNTLDQLGGTDYCPNCKRKMHF